MSYNNFYAEGNNGGDYFHIQQLDSGDIHLEVGHCCVKVVDSIIPIEFLTLALSEIVVSSEGGIKQYIEGSSWSDDFKKELLSKLG
jgi:ABC-type uncharacterized transport system auxiliary subunit